MISNQVRLSPIRTFENLTIVDGPSKDGLEGALFDRKPKIKRITFTTDDGLVFEAQVWGVRFGEEDRLWHIEGCALEPRGTVTMRNWRSCEVVFDTASRSGTFQYVQKGAEGV